MRKVLEVEETGRVLALHVRHATSLRRRAEGLLGCSALHPGQALVLEPAKQIHTFGMSFPIDVVFCDRSGTIRHLCRFLRPQRVTRLVVRSRYAVELPAGSLPGELSRGNRLRLVSWSGRDTPD